MPRYPRLFIPHYPLHIVQRGHNRRLVFKTNSDYRYYLNNLLAAKGDLKIRVLGYCLMPNHVHLVLVPGEDTSAISRLMRIVAARQTRRVNRLDERSGTLWEGRFKASLIDTDRYLLACCRYVDLNPVRAGMVEFPEDYCWSGFRGRIRMTADPLLDDHGIFDSLAASPAKRAKSYRRFVAQGICNDELSLIRQALQRNQLTGGDRFKLEVEAHTGRKVSVRPQGRPGNPGGKGLGK